ncbi:hypothetical protein TARUN_8418 [Trichoderma arundinaceum]|uniref:Uncharacterized protein n=1 Tax=Trichoderma arundinaceum TaxID=490622 RepID=A0A395NCK5_TRIAR|nr:hypothetical protein TARUN_8418 [Trichoderma arundinaceum]
MSKAGGVPDVWDDDDWEAQADRLESKEKQLSQAAPQPNLSRQERMQQHAEANRKLWESADSTETFHYIEAGGGGVPLTTSFKPQVKVLSRKPVIAKKDPVTGLAQLSLDDGDDSRPQEVQMTPEEIRAKQKRDREEKQRRYDEARAKIFGESAPSSRGSSPGTGTVTPPRQDGRGAHRGRGRGRGGNFNSGYNYSNSNISSESSSQQFEPRRPANQPAPRRELFDPSSSPKPDSSRRGGREGSSSDSSMRGQPGRDEHQAIRAPRGPDGSGRGGFGFARRGNRET